MIVITGTPGTGKTSLSDYLGKCLNLSVLHVNELVKQKPELSDGKENGSLLVDLEKLQRELKDFDGLVESHLLCEIKLPAKAFVLRTNPVELEKRLKEKGFGSAKVRENVEAEALDYCLIKARGNYEEVFQVDTTGLSVGEAGDRFVGFLESGESDFVDWSDFFLG